MREHSKQSQNGTLVHYFYVAVYRKEEKEEKEEEEKKREKSGRQKGMLLSEIGHTEWPAPYKNHYYVTLLLPLPAVHTYYYSRQLLMLPLRCHTLLLLPVIE